MSTRYYHDCGESFEHEEESEGVTFCSNCGTKNPELMTEHEYENENEQDEDEY